MQVPLRVTGFFYNPDSRRPTGTNAPARQGTRPLRASPTFGKPVPPGFSPRGCKGQSPLHQETKIPPSPEGKSALRARAGEWGQQSKLKAGQAGGKEGKPPRRGRQGQVEPSARRQMRKLSKQPQQQHLELHLLGNFTPQSFLRKILKTSCNLRRIVV